MSRLDALRRSGRGALAVLAAAACGLHLARSAVFVLLLVAGLPAAHAAPVTVRDDAGRAVTLPAPARRIVVLSPQLLELAAAAGASSRVIGMVRTPDVPPWARKLPVVGDAFALNLEAIVALHPDLVLAWRSGNPPRDLQRLRQLGIPVFESEADTFAALAQTVQRIGVLAGTPAAAQRWVRDFDARLAALRRQYAAQPPVRVFFEVWNRPLMTIGGRQLINEAISLCGGRNVFGDLPVAAPAVSIEAVLAADPQLIVTASPDGPRWLRAWSAYPRLAAVRLDQRVNLDPDALPRMGLRVLDGVQQLCTAVAATRRALQRHPAPAAAPPAR